MYSSIPSAVDVESALNANAKILAIEADVDSLDDTKLTTLRAGFLDNLNGLKGHVINQTNKVYKTTNPLATQTPLGSPASAWSLSAYQQLSADLGEDVLITGLLLGITNVTIPRAYQIEVATGLAGFEVVFYKARGTYNDGGTAGSTSSIFISLPIPFKIPNGTRLSWRVTDNLTTTTSYYCDVHYLGV